jgi:hypothetical protein
MVDVYSELAQLRQELGIQPEPTPQEDFKAFLEATNQLTPRALRAAEEEYQLSEQQELEEDWEAFLVESGQAPLPARYAHLRATARPYEPAMISLRSTIAEIAELKMELGIDETPQGEFEDFLEASKQLTPRALRKAEEEYKQLQAIEEEEDAFEFLKESGQIMVPPEHGSLESLPVHSRGSSSSSARQLQRAHAELEMLRAELGLGGGGDDDDDY